MLRLCARFDSMREAFHVFLCSMRPLLDERQPAQDSLARSTGTPSVADKLCSPEDTTCSRPPPTPPPPSFFVSGAVTSPVRTGHVTPPTTTTTRRNQTDTESSSRVAASSSRVGLIGGSAVGALAALLVAVGLGIYRYRRCYDGTYEIDAPSAMNGYVPAASSLSYIEPGDGAGTGGGHHTTGGRGKNKMNGTATVAKHHHRSTRELYV